MNQKGIGLLVLIVCSLIFGFLAVRFYGGTNSPKEMSIPDPNIKVQTKIVEGKTFALRYASYTDNEIKVGYEVTGITISKDNNIVCKLYNHENKITTSDTSGGGMVILADNQAYLTGIENISKRANLPDPMDLTVEITAIPTDSSLEPITVSFELPLKKENK